jgi:hypothetical protein
MGVHGKLCLWRALQVAANADASLTGLDYQLLIARAEAQHSQVEKQRLLTALALVPPSTGPPVVHVTPRPPDQR